jgi:hypothetical protein
MASKLDTSSIQADLHTAHIHTVYPLLLGAVLCTYAMHPVLVVAEYVCIQSAR